MKRVAIFIGLPVALLLCVYVGFCAVLFWSQDSFLYHPVPARPGDTGTAISFEADGAKLLVSTHAGSGDTAVLYFGGNGEDVTQSLPRLASAFPHAAIYALHYRGYGGSTGTPSEKHLVADGLLLFNAIYQEHRDITVIGRSLGSGVAIQVASLRPAARLVLVTPYNSIAELAAQQFKYLPIKWLLRDKYESWQFAPRIGVPTTIIAAERDRVIPMDSTLRLLSHFRPGIATISVIRNAGHNDISEYPEYVPALLGIEARANKSFKQKPLRLGLIQLLGLTPRHTKLM
jgi:pimeloyl-ACP methyl ester carboxylesterase